MNRLGLAVLVLLLAASSFAGSMIGLDALGKEDVVGATATTAGRGFAGGAKTGDGLNLSNPSNLAFEEKVSFSVTLEYELTEADDGDYSYSSGSLSIPSIYLAFPLGSFGAVAFGISQRYGSNLDVESSDSSLTQDVDLEYEGSVFEMVPVYAIRLPFYRRVSLGAAMHIVSGSNKRSLTLGPDNSAISDEDSWATNSTTVTEIAEGDWETESFAYYTLSAMYRGTMASMYFAFTTPYTLKNSVDYNFRFSQVDTLESYNEKHKIKVPITLSTGVDYRLFQNHHIMLDFTLRPWDDDIRNISGAWNMPDTTETQTEFLVALGYQKDGSKLFYDSYLKRMQFRLGAWYREWYIKDVCEFGGALGVGFPLGSRGTMVHLAVQGGMRDAGSSGEWDEIFLGFRMTLMGVGSWGQQKRTY